MSSVLAALPVALLLSGGVSRLVGRGWENGSGVWDAGVWSGCVELAVCASGREGALAARASRSVARVVRGLAAPVRGARPRASITCSLGGVGACEIGVWAGHGGHYLLATTLGSGAREGRVLNTRVLGILWGTWGQFSSARAVVGVSQEWRGPLRTQHDKFFSDVGVSGATYVRPHAVPTCSSVLGRAQRVDPFMCAGARGSGLVSVSLGLGITRSV